MRAERSHRALLILLGILAIAGALRAAYLSDLRKDPLYLSPALDAQLHDYWARGVASGDWTLPKNRTDPEIRTTAYFRPPGYPIVLSAVYRFTHGERAPTRVVQFGLGLVGVVLSFALARRYAGTTAGLVCAALQATSWVVIFFEGELLDAFLLGVLAPGMLLLVRLAADRGGALVPFAAGTALGAFSLVRPNGVALLPAMALWLVWARGRNAPRPEAWRAAGILLAAGLLAIAPATIRNVRVSGEWIPISANGGINLFIGNNPRADGIRAGIPDLESLAGISGWTCFEYPLVVKGLSRQVGRPLSYGEASSIWAAKARVWILENPGRFVALCLKRAALFVGPAEIGDRDLDLTRRNTPTLRRLPGRFSWYLAGGLTGLGLLVLEVRRARRSTLSAELSDRLTTASLLMLFVVVYAATFVPFFFNARYRVPVLVVLFVFGADTVVRVARGIVARRWQRVALTAASCVVLGAVASFDPTRYRPDVGEWHYQRANAYRDAGSIPAAISEYETAIRLSPRAVPPRRDLALVLRDRGRVDEAAALLAAALELDPQASEARFDLAQLFAASGRFEAAAEQYERVLAAAPRNANAHLSLGTAFLQLGRASEAMDHYRQAEALAPSDPLVAYVVGRGLLSQGRTAEALIRLRHAVELAPSFEAARRALEAAERGPGR